MVFVIMEDSSFTLRVLACNEVEFHLMLDLARGFAVAMAFDKLCNNLEVMTSNSTPHWAEAKRMYRLLSKSSCY